MNREQVEYDDPIFILRFRGITKLNIVILKL